MMSRFVLAALFGICIADPTGQLFHLKYFIFGGYLLSASWDWLRLKQPQRVDSRHTVKPLHLALFGFFAMALPLYGWLVMRWRSGNWNLHGDLTFFTAGGFLLFSLPLAALKQTRFALAAVHRLLLALAVVEIAVTLLEIYGWRTHPVNLLIISRNAVITTREYAQCTFPYIYFVAAPLLIFAAARCWFDFFSTRKRSPLIWGTVVSLALFVSGTRANQFMSLAGPVLFYVWWRKGLWGSLLTMGIIIGGLLVLVRVSGVLDSAGIISLSCGSQSGGGSLANAMLSTAEHSNAIKLSYLASYKLILSNPGVLLFGQGLDAGNWSEQVRNMLPENSNITELIYPEIIRIFGLIVGGMVLLGLALPVLLYRRFKKGFSYCAAAWCFYLLVAVSNPYIFSSNGMLIFGLVLAVMGLGVNDAQAQPESAA